MRFRRLLNSCAGSTVQALLPTGGRPPAVVREGADVMRRAYTGNWKVNNISCMRGQRERVCAVYKSCLIPSGLCPRDLVRSAFVLSFRDDRGTV